MRSLILKPPVFNVSNNSWGFRTISHPEITKIHSLFYRDRKKILPENTIEILEDRLVLAVWFMDDGCKWLRKSKEGGLILNTQSFKFEEVEKLSVIIEYLYGIKVGIHRDHNRFRLYINRKQQYKFSDLIKEYIIDALRYKLPVDP